MESGTFKSDLADSLKKLPKSHQLLVKEYKFKDYPENTIKGDKKSCGLIDEKNKTITIAAPWVFSREHTLLHEVAHLVWKYIDFDKKEWSNLVKSIKKNNKDPFLDQSDEEIFCMVYSSAYCEQPINSFNHEKWIKFVKNI